MDGVAFEEKERLEHGPYLRISPMFTEYVGDILITWDMTKFDQTCSNSFAYTVIGEGDVLFSQSRMGN